jgi:hypothetical protein
MRRLKDIGHRVDGDQIMYMRIHVPLFLFGYLLVWVKKTIILSHMLMRQAQDIEPMMAKAIELLRAAPGNLVNETQLKQLSTGSR